MLPKYEFTLLTGITIATIALAFFAVYNEYRKALLVKTVGNKIYPYKKVTRVAILIATKDGERTIARTLAAARATNRIVYVVSDGSTDRTVEIARREGARVLSLQKNVGKPAALHAAYEHFQLSKFYDAIAILDDDVVIEKDFIRQAKKVMTRDCAISVGKNITDWPDQKRWNIWLASRSYSYWAYQITLRIIQSSYNIMTCISGSNSLYRTEVLDLVLKENTPYIVDDTYWTLETHRLKLGAIKYAPKAKAWLQDPTTFKDWYKQNLRWMWGTFQGIIGHKIGTKANKFHLSYVALMVDWTIYVLSGPLTIFIIWQAGIAKLPIEVGLLFLGYTVWVAIAAIALKRPRLLLFVPAIVMADFIFRWIMLHGFLKALRQKTVQSCIWDSPERFDTRTPLLVKSKG